MPSLTRWYIKSALVFFVAALLAGLALALDTAGVVALRSSGLGPVYFHLFLVGWVTQLIFGIVFWMFPKATLERPRGSERLGWATFWLLNTGLILRAVGESLQAAAGTGAPIWGLLLVVSAVLQWLAGLGFVVNTWGRVKEK